MPIHRRQEVLQSMSLNEQQYRSVESVPAVIDPEARERRGRQWLIWSFIFCPCHLPVSMAVLAAVFGGTAFGTLLGRNTVGVGIIFALIYAAGVAVGFHHLRAAAAGKDCGAGSCEID